MKLFFVFDKLATAVKYLSVLIRATGHSVLGPYGRQQLRAGTMVDTPSNNVVDREQSMSERFTFPAFIDWKCVPMVPMVLSETSVDGRTELHNLRDLEHSEEIRLMPLFSNWLRSVLYGDSLRQPYCRPVETSGRCRRHSGTRMLRRRRSTRTF